MATITTLLFVPVATDDGNVLGHRVKKWQVHSLRCVPGKPIAATPLAKRLGLDGEMCRERITRKVRVKPRS